MREKIYFLAKGNFTYEPPKLKITPEKVEFDVIAGMKGETTFTVENVRGTVMKGFGFVEAPEVTFLPVFEGEKNVLSVEVDAHELISGTTLKGKLILVTDVGEIRVPYEINVVAPVLNDKDGDPVRDYFTLQKKAEADPREGLRLFRDPVFKETFLYRDPEGKLVYDRLMKGNTGLSGMEEFLVAFDKKQPVRFFPEYVGSLATANEDGIVYELEGSDIEDSISINCNAWGCIAIRVEVEGDFIEVDRKILWTDEFIDWKGRLDLKIVSGRVSEGRHIGKITFTSPYETHVVTVEVHSPVGAKDRKISRAKQAASAMLMRSILAYEEGRVSKDELKKFLQKHRSVLERLDLKYQVPLRGFMAYILGSEASKLEFYRDTEGNEIPAQGSDQTTVENYILNEYIKYLYSERDEDRERLAYLIDKFASVGYMSMILLLISMRVNYEQFGTPAKCVERVREELAKGGNSSLLYSELIRRYVKNPMLLNELDALNLRVLLYGLKQGLITKGLSDVVTVLAEGRGLPPIDGGTFLQETDPLMRGTGALLMRVLFGIYEAFPNSDTLRDICTLLIRYEKRDRRYFVWYERGVAERMRLTDLFEYYMYTVDPNDYSPLPQTVLSYFQYENHLNDTRKAYLYANIVKNKETNPDAYESYELQIEEFVERQIERERVTTDLGYLYEQILSPDMDDLQTEHLPHILFRHLLTCLTPGIESVTIVHLQTNIERTYPLDRGKALLDIYTPDYRLFFSDREGNQYVGSIDYTLERFFNGDEYAPLCYPVPDFPESEEVSDEEVQDVAAENTDEQAADTDSEKSADTDEQTTLELLPMDVPDNLLFHLAVRIEKKATIDERELDVLFRALASEKLRDAFCGRVFIRAYDHIMTRMSKDEREPYLRLLVTWLKPDTIKRSRIGELAEVCIRSGHYDQAEAMLKRYGRSGCGDDEMAELVIDRIRELDYEFDDVLVKWALILYRKGYHDHPILNYLLQYYMGETETLIALFRDSLPMKRVGTGADQLQSMEGHIRTNPAFYESVRERLLGQVLFSCSDTKPTEDIFIKYFDDGENRVLVKAYLSQIAYSYIVGKTELSDDIYEKIFRQASYEREPVMVLAALKHLVAKDRYNDKEREFIERSLSDMAAEGCIMPFMKEFSKDITVPYEIRTPVIVQYYSGTPDGVFLFVKNTKNEYESRPMKRVFDGIFIVSLLLFAGEETVGYIYEEETGKRSKEFELRKKEANSGGGSMFEQVNAMLEAKRDGDDRKYERLSREFAEEQQLAKQLFSLL